MGREWLAARRRARGWTQESLAHHLDVAVSTVQRWEQGTSEPTARLRRPYVDALDISLEDLDLQLRGPTTPDAAGGTGRLTGVPEPSARGHRWQISSETAADLETLARSYRRAYARSATVTELLPAVAGLSRVLTDLGRRGRWSGDSARLASLAGQTAVLAGLLHLMGHQDLKAARTNYTAALRAAHEAQDWDLASYVLGSLAFEASTAGRQADARALREAAWDLASQRAKPRTRAWVAALASELCASDGDEMASRRLLDEAFDAMEQTGGDPHWSGVGWFDEARLRAYEGGNLVLLGQHATAADLLRGALARLDPARLKHRCTLSADLAMALAHLAEVDESCARAGEALSFATAISHQESVERVRRVHARLARWPAHPGVRQLGARLDAA